ncbi:phosphoglycerate mutase family protein [Coleophoma cylindrospora]|uniref:Phosphoglycerate mutase family protein n=1 Tax=Coleophoma cylindrospora TaxID=1849047 RepID=A0A3D8QGB6_9HELO|nr:phosphoglycerate mutase family protein [Coleophoma cylindrospora]
MAPSQSYQRLPGSGTSPKIRNHPSRQHSWCRKEVLVPVLFFAAVFIALVLTMDTSTPLQEGQGHTHIVYSTVTGYFQQDDPKTDPKTFDYTKSNFGLIDREYATDAVVDPQRKKTQWERFEQQVTAWNSEAKKTEKKVAYKLLYLGRHGQGFHNVAETFYGTKAWDCYYSLQTGNSTSTWADAHLTDVGIAQARANAQFWTSQIQTQKMPTADTYYTSPLTRCLQTCNETFSSVPLPAGAAPFAPVIKELFREAIGVHTCDRRSSKSYIASLFPRWSFEDGFAEDDPLWDAELRETNRAMDVRTKRVLDDVFAHDEGTWLSVTAHSGEIGSVLRVLGHREFGLGTGEAIPVLVRAEWKEGDGPVLDGGEWMRPVTCKEPPVVAKEA